MAGRPAQGAEGARGEMRVVRFFTPFARRGRGLPLRTVQKPFNRVQNRFYRLPPSPWVSSEGLLEGWRGISFVVEVVRAYGESSYRHHLMRNVGDWESSPRTTPPHPSRRHSIDPALSFVG